MAPNTAFVHSLTNTDPVMRALVDLENALVNYWKDNQALIESPLGECAALAAATRVFYQEQCHKLSRSV